MVDTSIRVSVIIDNYNYDEFLGQAIESALSQTYKNVEVIVVDDGSTDSSREVLRRFENCVKVILKENGGQASAFNAGFAESSGELVGFLDSDDLLLPHAVETAVASWQESFSKLQFPLAIIDRVGKTMGGSMPRQSLDSGDLQETLLATGRYVSSPTSGNIFSRKFLMQVLPIPECEWGKTETGDGYLNICAPFYGGIGALRACLGLYRVHGMSMSSTSVGGSINLSQIQKVIRHHQLESSLLAKIAAKRGLEIKSLSLTGHWAYLKLIVAQIKLGTKSYSLALIKSGWNMIISALTDPQLSVIRKAQNVAWTAGVLLLPKKQAIGLINVAFDTSSPSRLLRALRRL